MFCLLPLLESLAPVQSEGDRNGVGTGMSILDVTDAMVTLVEGCLASLCHVAGLSIFRDPGLQRHGFHLLGDALLHILAGLGVASLSPG